MTSVCGGAVACASTNSSAAFGSTLFTRPGSVITAAQKGRTGPAQNINEKI